MFIREIKKPPPCWYKRVDSDSIAGSRDRKSIAKEIFVVSMFSDYEIQELRKSFWFEENNRKLLFKNILKNDQATAKFLVMFPDRTNKLIQKRNFLDSCVFQEKLKNYKLVCMLAKLHLTLLPVKIRDKDAIMCRSWDFCYYTLKLTNPKNTVKTFQHRDGNINSVWLNVSKAQKLIEISNILCNTISKDVVAIILDFSC